MMYNDIVDHDYKNMHHNSKSSKYTSFQKGSFLDQYLNPLTFSRFQYARMCVAVQCHRERQALQKHNTAIHRLAHELYRTQIKDLMDFHENLNS